VETEDRVVVFDGLCNLCSGGARWVQHHQARPRFRLVPMQSDLGRALLTQHGYDPDDLLTFLILDGSQRLTQSDAWIHLIAAAGGGWRLIHATRIIRRGWRDAVYRLIARNRYRWFGRRNTCYLLQPPKDSESRQTRQSHPPRSPQSRSSPPGVACATVAQRLHE
jgi:predicted DCC family thiol-disulfide oxidoreductase YuxK